MIPCFTRLPFTQHKSSFADQMCSRTKTWGSTAANLPSQGQREIAWEVADKIISSSLWWFFFFFNYIVR